MSRTGNGYGPRRLLLMPLAPALSAALAGPFAVRSAAVLTPLHSSLEASSTGYLLLLIGFGFEI